MNLEINSCLEGLVRKSLSMAIPLVDCEKPGGAFVAEMVE
jgi:hypothetical protein